MTTQPAASPYRGPSLAAPGAVAADPPDDGVAAHLGDPMREQRRLASGSGWVDLSHRGVVRVSGPDRLGWLNSLTSQQLADLAPGEPVTTLVLSPHGHVEHALLGVDDGTAFWAHVEPGTAPSLVDWLIAMRFLMQVEVEDITAEYGVIWQPLADASSGHLARTGTPDSLGGREVFVPRPELAEHARSGGPVAGVWALEARRIAAGVPRLGRETDHRTIPNEVGWIGPAVHLDKGCYRGQETVARVHNLGRPPRRLVRLQLDGSVDRLPAHGDPVGHEGRPMGFVGSAARHYELGPVALAVVKRAVPVDAPLLAAGIAASQEVLVDPDVGLHVRAGRDR